ncbi:flagellar assembly protein FliW [Candidatus Latescibacterota bacterium]
MSDTDKAAATGKVVAAQDAAEADTVTFSNAKFGDVTVASTSIVTFPDGVPGFERCKRFGLVSIDDEAPFLRLLSVDEPTVGFVILNPMMLWKDYNPGMGSEDLEGLDVQSPDDLEMYCIVTLSDVPENVTANLKGPIAINTRAMTARQLILMDDRYHTKHALLAASREQAEAK